MTLSFWQSSYSFLVIGIDVFPIVAYNTAVIPTKNIIRTKKKQRQCFIFSQTVQSSCVSYKDEDIGNITKTYIKVIIKIIIQAAEKN